MSGCAEESRPVSHKLKKGELNAPDPSPEPKHKQGDDEDSDGQDDGEQSNASEENSGAEQADDHIDLNPGSMKVGYALLCSATMQGY